jgi:biotin transport system substrate-specific component
MDVGVVFAGAAVTAIGAQITIPTLPVPITLQTMGVMLCGLTLGARRGALSQLLYLAAGAAGAPVFAAWSGGPARLFGPTGGYLVSFVLIAGLLGWLAERGWDRRVSTCAAALAIAFPLQLFLGTAWLAVYLGWSKAWMAGFVPFIGWEASKGLVVLVLLPGVNSLLGRQPTPRL